MYTVKHYSNKLFARNIEIWGKVFERKLILAITFYFIISAYICAPLYTDL